MSTPINVMLAKACEPLLKIRFYFLAKKYLAKVSSNINHPLSNNLTELLRLVTPKNPYNVLNSFTLLSAFQSVFKHQNQIKRSNVLPYFEVPYSDHLFIPKVVADVGHEVQKSVNPPLLFKDILNNKYKNHLCFYTDGSKTKNLKRA